jgi:hypothetical protein
MCSEMVANDLFLNSRQENQLVQFLHKLKGYPSFNGKNSE